MTTTINQIKRTEIEFSEYAGESVKVDIIQDAIYAFCSELAALRLHKKYGFSNDKAHSAYSKNLKTWYFRLDVVAYYE